MTRLFRRLWHDDDGAVISVELVLIIGILIFGMIPGYIALRNAGISFMVNVGNLANALIPSFTFSGFTVLAGDAPNQTTIVQVNGISFTPTPVNLTGDQIAPIQANVTLVPPSP
jgi:Flp pilus assembly pilin Flp